MRPPVYYLVSCAGVPNYGDELITASWLRHIARVKPDAEVIVDCIRPEVAEVTLGPLHPSTRFVDTLWMLALENQRDDARRAVEAVEKIVTSGAGPMGHAIDDLLGADVLHLVGGGLLNGLYSWTLGLLAGVTAAASRGGGQAVVTGQGLCPQRAELVPLVRSLFERLDVADVRDGPSAALLGLAGVVASADDVFLTPGPWMYDLDADVPDVMVCAQCEVAPTKEAPAIPAVELADFIVRTLRSWQIPGQQVGFTDCFPGIDTTVFDLVAGEMDGIRLYTVSDILDKGLPTRAGQAWISTRFHPHLVAAAAGISGIALSVVPDYYDIKHWSLIDQGSNWALETISAVPERPRGGGFDPVTVAALTERKRSVADRIYP